MCEVAKRMEVDMEIEKGAARQKAIEVNNEGEVCIQICLMKITE